jgi:exonuclease VII small subunit
MQQALELQRREVELKSLRKEIVDLREFRFKSMESLHEGERLTNDSMFNMDEEEDEVGLEEKNKALERHVEDLRGKVAELEQVVAHFETRRTEHVDEVKKGFSKLISGLKSRVKELDREKKELEENLIELRT